VCLRIFEAILAIMANGNSEGSPAASETSKAGDGFGQMPYTTPSGARPGVVPQEGNGSPQYRGAGQGGRSSVPSATGSSPNLGLQRKSGKKRVVGGNGALKQAGTELVKSYKVASKMQFNDVEELRGDSISHAYAQEILEKLWAKWELDTSDPSLMRKAEDVVHALFAMRTASPDADYNVYVLLGQRECSLQDISDLLFEEEVTRRRFARAISDDIRSYITEPDNGRLREMLTVVLGVKSEYSHLAFDGSTHCSGMSPNQIMFTKNLERMNLFDTQEVRDKLGSTQMLATGGFQVNRGRGAFS